MLTIPLSGNGVATPSPSMTVTPTSVQFADRSVGTRSPAETVTVTNDGTARLDITTVRLEGIDPGQFSQTNNCANSSLAPDESCTASVRFEPSSRGEKNASLDIASNAGTRQVALTGTATGAGGGDTTAPTVRNLSVSPDPFRSGGGRSATLSASIGEAATVRFRIFNLAGRLVKSFAERVLERAGTASVTWNGKNRNGVLVRTADYRLRVRATDAAGNVGSASRLFRVIHP